MKIRISVINQKQIFMIVILSSISLFLFSCSTNLKLSQNINQNKDSAKVGVWIVVEDSSCIIRLETYNNGVLSGPYFEYYLNGVLATKGKYRNGKKVGWWVFTSSLNYTFSKQKYRNGEIKKSFVYPPFF